MISIEFEENCILNLSWNVDNLKFLCAIFFLLGYNKNNKKFFQIRVYFDSIQENVHLVVMNDFS